MTGRSVEARRWALMSLSHAKRYLASRKAATNHRTGGFAGEDMVLLSADDINESSLSAWLFLQADKCLVFRWLEAAKEYV